MFSKCDRREETGFCQDVSYSTARDTHRRAVGRWVPRASGRDSPARSHPARPLSEELPWLVGAGRGCSRRVVRARQGKAEGGWAGHMADAGPITITPCRASDSRLTCGPQQVSKLCIVVRGGGIVAARGRLDRGK